MGFVPCGPFWPMAIYGWMVVFFVFCCFGCVFFLFFVCFPRYPCFFGSDESRILSLVCFSFKEGDGVVDFSEMPVQ